MLKIRNNIVLWLLIAGVIPFGLYALSIAVEDWSGNLPDYGQVDWLANSSEENYLFYNQDSLIFDREVLDDKVVVVNYFFTSCPTICPAMMRNMQIVQEGYLVDDEVQLVSFTVDPKRDSPEALYSFGKKYNVISSKWNLITGQKSNLYALARNDFRLSALEGTIDSGGFIHSENLVLIDRQGVIRGYYDGTEDKSIKKLLKDIRKLI